MTEPLEVERELEALRVRVRGLNVPDPTGQLTPLQKAISSVNAHWYLSGKYPPPTQGTLPQRVIYFFKRVARRVMVEVLNTLVEQQNAFNAQVARALTELAMRDAKIAELEKRIAELEQRAASAPSPEAEPREVVK